MYTSVHKGLPEGRLLIQGQGPLKDVVLNFVETSLSLSAEQHSATEEAVRTLTERGLVVTNGPTCRLESWRAGSILHLSLSEGRYFDSVLLKHNPHWGLRSQVLAVVCVTECVDGFVIEKRSDKVATLAGYFHPSPSGSVEPSDHPFQTLLTEAKEELGLLPDELRDIQCLGLVFGEESGVYQLVCRVTVSLTLEEILQRNCEGEWERSALICAPKCSQELPLWIAEHLDSLTVGGRVALILEGGRRWGSTWFEDNMS